MTGGAGFVGGHLVRALLDRGMRVRVLDDFSTGRKENLADLPAVLIVGDIRNRGVLRQAMRGVRWVFHQAALVSVPGSLKDPQTCYQINLGGSLNLLEEAHRAGVQRVVLASSAAVYGEAERPVAEQAAKVPLSPYAASKLAMEQAAQLYTRCHKLATVSLRYFNVYGPRQRPDSMYAAVIPAFIAALQGGRPPMIYGDGEQRRDFVHVEDVARANLLAAQSEQAVGGVFNIGGGGSISIAELAEILHGYFPEAPGPERAPARVGDIYFSEAVLAQAAEHLGYRPAVDIRDGLRTTVEWFGQQRHSAPA